MVLHIVAGALLFWLGYLTARFFDKRQMQHREFYHQAEVAMYQMALKTHREEIERLASKLPEERED